MVPADDVAPEARPPRLTDLVALCRQLNDARARYVVIGGMAVIHAGFVRATEAIDLLVEASRENIARLRQALRSLPDRAIDEMADSDLDQYVVVRVADEIVVDLMKAACGIEYDEASRSATHVVIDGVNIPFASPALLWRTKQTLRDKDPLDRAFSRVDSLAGRALVRSAAIASVPAPGSATRPRRDRSGSRKAGRIR